MSNLENSKNFQFGKLKKNLQFGKFQKFPIRKILKNLNVKLKNLSI